MLGFGHKEVPYPQFLGARLEMEEGQGAFSVKFSVKFNVVYIMIFLVDINIFRCRILVRGFPVRGFPVRILPQGDVHAIQRSQISFEERPTTIGMGSGGMAVGTVGEATSGTTSGTIS